MGKPTEYEYDKLSWALDFIQTNLNPVVKTDQGEFPEPLPVLEKLKIQDGLKSFIGRYKPGQGTDWSDEGQIRELAASITEPEWDKTTRIQQAMRKVLEKVVSAKGDEQLFTPVLSLPRTKVDLYVDKEQIRVEPSYKSDEDIAVYKFVQLLCLIPPSAIGQCEGCKRYFFNPTQRKKRFCDIRCTWKYGAKKRREADLEEYRKKQKDVMRKRRKEGK